jgi:hypothetical protein
MRWTLTILTHIDWVRRSTFVLDNNTLVKQVLKLKEGFERYKEVKDRMAGFEYYKSDLFAPLTVKSVPAPDWNWETEDYFKKQKGNNPMRNYNTVASFTQAPLSDAATQRNYLLERLDSLYYPKTRELEKTFNLYVDNTPKNYQELIDAIKGDKFKITEKAKQKLADMKDRDAEYIFPDPTYGFIWDGPQPDRKGYSAALNEMEKTQTAARDTIMTGDAAAGLSALQAFEAWTPTPTTAAN